MNPLVKAIA